MDEMDEIEFIFQVSEFDEETLVPQISAALERRMQINQEALPKLLKKAVNRKMSAERFEQAAREFLESHRESLKEKDAQICFSTEEMITVMGELEDLDQEAVSFDEIQLVMETKDIFFMIYGGRGVLLQKKDLDEEIGTLDEFREFVNENIKKIIDLREE